MSQDINQITLTGRLTSAAELRFTQSGKAVVNFNLACNRRKNAGQECDFIPVVAWEKLAEIVNEYCIKGSLVAVVGRLQTRKYEKDGQSRSAFEVLANEVKLLGHPSNSRSIAPPARQSEWASDAYGSDIGLEDIPF